MADDYFSATYCDARGKFLHACLEAGVSTWHYRNPERGPAGQALFTDVGLIGSPDAQRYVIVTSATHGVEGFTGSGIQVALLRDPEAPRPGGNTALLLVHAINPYGFSWLRRVNEDNVDLNRNFVDHEGGNYPENDLFEKLVDHVLPAQWDDESVAAYKARMTVLAEEFGRTEVNKALAKGQYRHPKSPFFGGNKATWSNRTLAEICGRALTSADAAILIDVHSGLGPYGYGELMTPSKPGEPVYDRLHAWYGDQVHSTTAGASDYAGSKGSILNGFRPPVSSVDYVSVGLEYGTRERDQVRTSVLGDHWLHLHGALDSELGRDIKRRIRDSFYPDEPEWKTMVRDRGHEVVGIALAEIGAL